MGPCDEHEARHAERATAARGGEPLAQMGLEDNLGPEALVRVHASFFGRGRAPEEIESTNSRMGW